jgi:hypothetical protein
MTLHKITEFYTEWFSVCPNITSKFRNTAVFKSFVKCKNDSNKTCRYARDSFYVPNLICLSATVREIFKKGNFMYHVPSKFVILVSHKNDLLEVVHLLKIYQHTQFYCSVFIGSSFAYKEV